MNLDCCEPLALVKIVSTSGSNSHLFGRSPNLSCRGMTPLPISISCRPTLIHSDCRAVASAHTRHFKRGNRACWRECILAEKRLGNIGFGKNLFNKFGYIYYAEENLESPKLLSLLTIIYLHLYALFKNYFVATDSHKDYFEVWILNDISYL